MYNFLKLRNIILNKNNKIMKNVIEILKNKYSENEPISIQDIRVALPEYTRGRIYQIIDELEDKGQLKRFDQGIYYIPKKTIFGDSVLDPRKIINKKYITDGENNYGYYTGIALLNAFGISTQSANIVEIRTNNESTNKRTVCIGKQQVIIKKSRAELNNDNYAAMMILEIFNLITASEIDSKDFSQVIEFAREKNLTSDKIMQYAKDMPAKAAKNFIVSEVNNVLASR